MTVKLTVVYGTPDDKDSFDKHYADVHLPIVQRWPGLQRAEVARVSGGPMGTASPYHWIAELYFDDEAALNEALGSPAGAEAGKDFGAIAPPGSFMTVSTIVE
jgi:uncharacterized protein (TIGR02118 family)